MFTLFLTDDIKPVNSNKIIYVNAVKMTDTLPFAERNENDINIPVCINILLTKTYEEYKKNDIGKISRIYLNLFWLSCALLAIIIYNAKNIIFLAVSLIF